MRSDIIYLSGIIDGEGHFYKPLTINGRGEKRFYPRIVIANTNLELIRWIRAKFGGSVYFYSKSGTKGCYRWQIQGLRATELAKLMLPYLIVKKEQVKRIL